MVRGIETFDPGGSAGFGTWLVTIAKNCYVDHLRRSRVLPEDIDALPLPGGVDPAEAVERKLQCEELLAEPEAPHRRRISRSRSN